MIKPVLPFKPTESLQTLLALFLCLALGFTVLTALGFQYIGGLMPCKLCLQERVPYYLGAPIMLVAFLLSLLAAPGFLVRLLFIAVVVLMAYNLGLSIYHAGAEWKLWMGPTDCTPYTGALPQDATNLLGDLNKQRPVSCSDAPGYFLGLSMAGWNGVACLFYMLCAIIGAFAGWKKTK